MKVLLHTLTITASLTFYSVSEAIAAGGHHGDAAHEAKSGLPQMDPTWFPSQIFWLIVTFAFLYVVFSKRVLPELSSILESRRSHIQGDLDTAASLKDEAEDVHKAYDKILEEARDKSSKIFAENEALIKDKIDTEFKNFKERSANETESFERRIENAKQEAFEQMNTIAAELAADATAKIIGQSADMKKAMDAVETVNKNKSKAA